MRRPRCLLGRHDDEIVGIVADSWLVTAYRRCRRRGCRRWAVWNHVTLKGFDRAARETFVPLLRRDLNERNPLLRYLDPPQ